jgi:phosphoenolpyruvate phosphomutase
VARTEAFIVGRGLSEALRRAEAYHRAGADAILMHSKISTPDQILAFMTEWKNTCPVVIVPTTYFSTPTKQFKEAGVSMVIWANHLLRSSITAMQQAASKLYKEQTLMAVVNDIASVKEIFRLQNADELGAAESLYLPPSDTTVNEMRE